ncbi:MAG: YccF domain-containing protein [Bacteroidota bacterium]
MRTLGNIIWLIFGGIFIAVEYLIGSIVMMLTIIGIPFGIQTLKLAGLALWPFDKEIVYKNGEPGCLSTFMNVLWILTGGIWISLTHILFGLFFGLTIIGIPWAIQHFKLAGLAIAPFGKDFVYKD